MRKLAQQHGEGYVYMLSHDADFLIEIANRIAPAAAIRSTGSGQ